MAKKPEAQYPQDQQVAAFVLNKSFGAIVAGKHKLWPAGTEFDAGKDNEVIALLARSGADLTQK